MRTNKEIITDIFSLLLRIEDHKVRFESITKMGMLFNELNELVAWEINESFKTALKK